MTTESLTEHNRQACSCNNNTNNSKLRLHPTSEKLTDHVTSNKCHIRHYKTVADVTVAASVAQLSHLVLQQMSGSMQEHVIYLVNVTFAATFFL